MMKKKFSFNILSFFLIIFLTGCSSLRNVSVAVNSYTDYSVPLEKTYYLMPPLLDETLVYAHLEQQQFAVQVDSMLSQKGYRKVFDKKIANYIIDWSYLVEGPFRKETVIRRMEPSSSIDFYSGFSNRRRDRHYSGIGLSHSFGDFSEYSDYIEISEYYISKLFIKASYKNMRIAWELSAFTNSQNNIIRNTFPYLLEASKEFVGIDTQKAIIVKIPENFQTLPQK